MLINCNFQKVVEDERAGPCKEQVQTWYDLVSALGFMAYHGNDNYTGENGRGIDKHYCSKGFDSVLSVYLFVCASACHASKFYSKLAKKKSIKDLSGTIRTPRKHLAIYRFHHHNAILHLPYKFSQ